jgi:sortase (surface protein transpeptidase)
VGVVAVTGVWALGNHPTSSPPTSLPSPTTASSAPESRTSSTPGGGSSAPSAPAVTSTPTSLSIPGIGVDTGLVRLGLNDDDTVEVPSEPGRAGWFFPGTVPGQPGSSVILGHVDSTRGPAVFYRLRELVRGDRILVRMSDGSSTRFKVTRVVTYPNDEFPAHRVYAGTPGRATLNLVTCGGVYDADAGGYQANVVAYAELATST